jgi:RNA polymerase sigma factor (TIGR02999 family)
MRDGQVRSDEAERRGEAPSDPPPEILGEVYSRLRRLAAHYVRQERPGHTLQATALVHEAYLRMLRGGEARCGDPRLLLAACARAMRRILVDHERRRRRLKRGGARQRVGLDGAEAAAPERTLDLLALDEGIARLEAIDPVRAAVVELRFFGGLTAAQVAEHLGLSEATVNRYWTLARVWLHRELACHE